MTTSISSAKRVRTSEKARVRNIAIRSRVSSTRRQTIEALGSKDVEAGVKQFREYCSTLDKAVKKGVIRKNTGIRRKRRAAVALAALQASAAPAANS